ncbi:hypothetical protein [Nostocoides sp. HKS02]|uniref:hypothetical protein n=1 Tax=Nostocoides sp. HKS02 TaxID=1813880 RepID=UPI0012B46674|nr:hypothetical protein [Tetrasphaera sp. HKS02]QGN58885.1 hypothetical protein GKE56_14440 [Tetrasphaera sp. HKS02]
MRAPLRIVATIAITALAALSIVPAASAGQPTREVFTVNSDDVFTHWCSFPVRLQETGSVIVITYAGSGDVVKESDIATNYRGTLTNQSTGVQISLAYPGGLHISYYADGSYTTRGTGPTIIAPPIPNPATGALGLWLVRGQFRFHVDAAGTITSSSLTGTEQDLCAELAR